ncbi:DUF4381 domain-containing protein [Lutimaribacter marinistellae]|uniref:DUF4381 domain-containing protein n=1 Tax=Lutimaribacter marinistellae TaxID=1820329 RepID=A0ABV7TAY3_9RHOB
MNEEDTPQALNLIDLLDGLVEPPVPEAVAMTPQTAGWAVLAVLVLLGLLWLVLRFVRRWRANAYRRAALAELGAAGDDPAVIAAVLRRTALAAWPREEVASLTGEAWLRFLDRTGGKEGFAAGPGQAMEAAVYRGGTTAMPELTEMAARWIRQHDAGGGR